MSNIYSFNKFLSTIKWSLMIVDNYLEFQCLMFRLFKTANNDCVEIIESTEYKTNKVKFFKWP